MTVPAPRIDVPLLDFSVEAVRAAGVPVYDITHQKFGCKGDGSDETLKIRAAIDACYRNGGGIVFAPVPPAGFYGVTLSIEIPETVLFLGASFVTWRDAAPAGVVLKALPGSSPDLRVVRIAGATATPAPIYSLVTASVGGGVRNIAVDLSNLGADARGISVEGAWFWHLDGIRALGITSNTQIGIYIGPASTDEGGPFWNRVSRYMFKGVAGAGIGLWMQGATDGSVRVPTQTLLEQIHMEGGYRGFVFDHCGSGIEGRGCSAESMADNGVTVTNMQSGAEAIVWHGGELSTNAGYGWSGDGVLRDTKMSANGAGATDGQAVRYQRDPTNGWYKISGRLTADNMFGAWVAKTLAAGAVIDPTVGDMIALSSTGGVVSLDATTPIAAGKPGQTLSLRGGSATNYFTLASVGNVRMESSTFDLPLDYTITFSWDSNAGAWVERSRSPSLLGVVTLTNGHTVALRECGARFRYDLSAGSPKVHTVTNALPVGHWFTVGRIDSNATTLTVSGAGCTFNTGAAIGAASVVLGAFKSASFCHAGGGVWDVYAVT